MRIQAVVADLDGTVVRSEFSISPATLEALHTLKAASIPFVIATARTPPGLERFEALAHATDVAVCCSGAIGWSSHRKAMTWMEWLTLGAARRVVEIATSNGAGVASFDGTLWRMTEEYRRLSPVQPRGPTRLVVDESVVAATPCCTMALRHADGSIEHIAALVAAEADSAALSHVGRSTVLDVTAPGVDKGTGARRALAELGVPARAAVSFGDMPNDLPLFRVTGRSYSVGECDPAVVGAASEVLPSVEDDGFARKIADLAGGAWEIDDRVDGLTLQ